MQWLGHTVSAFSVWKGTTKLSSTVAIPFFCPRHHCMSEWVSPFLRSLTSIWWDLLIIIQESVSCPLLPQSRLETSFNSLLNSSITATFLEVLLVPWGIFFLLYFSLHLDLVKHLIQNKILFRNQDLLDDDKIFNTTRCPSSFKTHQFCLLLFNRYVLFLKLVLKIRHTQPFLKSPQPLDPTLKSEYKLSDRTRQTP